ncbi:MAG: hypothetical protein UY34_C0016G0031, partial [Parcubacteria group bacterium GW2011_GWA2_48_9]
ALSSMERETGFAPATSSLARKRSTAELLPHMPGARVELATPASSGQRSTDELPRLVVYHSLVGAGGLEPPTSSLSVTPHNFSLSLEVSGAGALSFPWWAREDSNLRPRHYQ